MNKEELTIYEAELQRQTRLNQPSSLLSYEDIGVLMGYSSEHVRKNIVTLPHFPAPEFKTKFLCGKVKVFMKNYLNQAA